jgi:hypothetical protein
MFELRFALSVICTTFKEDSVARTPGNLRSYNFLCKKLINLQAFFNSYFHMSSTVRLLFRYEAEI